MNTDRPFILSTITGIILTVLFAACCVISVAEGSMYTAVGGMLCIVLIARRLFTRGSIWMLVLITLIAAFISAYRTWTGPGFEATIMNIIRYVVEENLFFAVLVIFAGTTKFFNFLEYGGMWKYILILLLSMVISTLALSIMAVFEVVIGVLCIVGFGGGMAASGGMSTSGSGTGSKPVYYDKNGRPFTDRFMQDQSNQAIDRKNSENN